MATLATLAPLAAVDAAAQTRGMMLLTCIVALGLIGIAMITGLAVARHRHWQRLRQEQKRNAEKPPVDPWEEAGRRMPVPDMPEAEKEKTDGVTPP